MKAKQIRKIRNKYRPYYVSESKYLFGGDFGLQILVLGRNPQDAVYRWQQLYWLRHKSRCSHFTHDLCETNHDYGYFKVVDEEGFIRYYC